MIDSQTFQVNKSQFRNKCDFLNKAILLSTKHDTTNSTIPIYFLNEKKKTCKLNPVSL